MTVGHTIHNAYDIRNSRGTAIARIFEHERDRTTTSLVLHGRGATVYGIQRNQNLVHLLENFANNVSPNNPIDGQLWWNLNDQMYVWDSTEGISGDWVPVVPTSVGIGFSVVQGDGLTGSPLPSGSPLTVIVNVGAGTGISVAANTISTNDSTIVHDNLFGFVANEHIDHSALSVNAGAGLTGGGDLTASRSIDVGAGTGISVAADAINVDQGVIALTTVGFSFTAQKTFTGNILLNGSTASAAVPAISFDSDADTGIYRASSNGLNFATGATQRFRIESNGVLRSLNTTYETLVINPTDIPNKKYVDDAAVASSFPTENTFVGTSSISGLDGTQTYLVTVYGIIPDKATGFATLDQIRVYRGSTTPGLGTLAANTPSATINWPDGDGPTEAAFVVTMSGSTSINAQINRSSTGGSTQNARLMTAVQLTDN